MRRYRCKTCYHKFLPFEGMDWAEKVCQKCIAKAAARAEKTKHWLKCVYCGKPTRKRTHPAVCSVPGGWSSCEVQQFEDGRKKDKERHAHKWDTKYGKHFVCDKCESRTNQLFGRNECWTCYHTRQKAESAATKSLIKLAAMTDAMSMAFASVSTTTKGTQ